MSDVKQIRLVFLFIFVHTIAVPTTQLLFINRFSHIHFIACCSRISSRAALRSTQFVAGFLFLSYFSLGINRVSLKMIFFSLEPAINGRHILHVYWCEQHIRSFRPSDIVLHPKMSGKDTHSA